MEGGGKKEEKVEIKFKTSFSSHQGSRNQNEPLASIKVFECLGSGYQQKSSDGQTRGMLFGAACWLSLEFNNSNCIYTTKMFLLKG